MKNHKNTTVQLNDGKSVLHTWSQDFNKLPTVGDILEINTQENQVPAGYRNEAKVLLIETHGTGTKLVLEATPLAKQANRPVLVMNKNYVPKRLRVEAETFLRERFDIPTFDWINSDLPQPIIDVHMESKPPIKELRKITDELRALLLKDSPLAFSN